MNSLQARSPHVAQVLLICILAGALDTLGDEGNRFARSTIMPQRFPETKIPAFMSLISSSNVLATFLCMTLVRWHPRSRS